MANISGPSNTQKMIMLALVEGWRLRFVGNHGWCMFQNGRTRPFAQVAQSTVEKMTVAGWLTAGIATKELDFRPEKLLTAEGRRSAEKLLASGWAENAEWAPQQQQRDSYSFNQAACLGDRLAAAA